MKIIDKPVVSDEEVQAFIDKALAEAPPLTGEKRDFITRVFSNV